MVGGGQARRAGELALAQSRWAERLGNEVLAAQCRLYVAEALVRLGRASAARAIIARERAAFPATPAVQQLVRALDALLVPAPPPAPAPLPPLSM
jgi:hypothetical protein